LFIPVFTTVGVTIGVIILLAIQCYARKRSSHENDNG
jgi:hypothetical protein